MIIYVSSDLPAYFKINGEYASKVNKNLKSFEVYDDNALFEILPTNSNYLPCYGDVFGGTNLKAFKVQGGVLLYPVFKPQVVFGFKMLGQVSCDVGGVLTQLSVVLDGLCRFYLDGALSVVENLPFIPEKYELYHEKGLLFASFSREKTALFIYDVSTRRLVYSDVVSAFSFSETLTVKKEYLTTIYTTITERWNLIGEVSLISTHDEKEKSFLSLNPSLIGVAFFESVIIGASVEDVASPALIKRTKELKEFLGKVIRVLPSPSAKGEVWLITENEVIKGIPVYENGFINNVLLDDF
ncbi:MAG: hypothetical protein IKL82_06565 [Clostridia bacterium]|nr:hypothetical protein [Clostridia bacterium]